MRHQCNDDVVAGDIRDSKVSEERRVCCPRREPLALKFGPSRRNGVGPGGNTQGEWSATQRERTKRLVGVGQASVEINVAQGDWKGCEVSINAPSLTGSPMVTWERASEGELAAGCRGSGRLNEERGLHEVERATFDGGEQNLAVDRSVDTRHLGRVDRAVQCV